MSIETRVRRVGVDLQDSEDTRLLVEAMEADNTGLTVSQIPGIIKVQSTGELVIRRQTVEEKAGRPWATHEFQLNIVSYSGNISEWDDDKIVIKWEH
jgi:phenol hydroxylase P2 protein